MVEVSDAVKEAVETKAMALVNDIPKPESLVMVDFFVLLIMPGCGMLRKTLMSINGPQSTHPKLGRAAEPESVGLQICLRVQNSISGF